MGGGKKQLGATEIWDEKMDPQRRDVLPCRPAGQRINEELRQTQETTVSMQNTDNERFAVWGESRQSSEQTGHVGTSEQTNERRGS